MRSRGRTLLAPSGLVAALSAAATVQAATLTVELVDYNAAAQQYLESTLVPQFEASHPGVTVEFVRADWGSLNAKISAWYAAGEEPDVMQVGSQYIGLLAPQGLIQPIDAFTRNWPDLADYPKAEIEDGTYQGHLYDIPLTFGQRTLYYRKDLFEKFGLDPERPPANWDELVVDAKKLTVLSDSNQFEQAGFTVPTDVQPYLMLAREAGGFFLSPDLRTVTINSAGNVRAAEFMSDLVNQNHVSPPGGFSDISANAAMSISGVNPLYVDEPGVEIAPALPPAGPAGRGGILFVDKWVIGSQAKDPKLAWDFIAAVSEPDALAALSRIGEESPPRLALLKYEPWASDPRWQTIFASAEYTTAFRNGVPVAADFIHSGAQPFTQLLDDILNRRKPAAAAWNELAQKEQGLLDEFWAKQRQ